jgi:hypothetical protein
MGGRGLMERRPYSMEAIEDWGIVRVAKRDSRGS